MKYSEIEKFTRSGNYEVNISLGYVEQAIKDYEKTYNLQLNPDFQRGHVWSEKQQIAFMEFFLKGGRGSEVIYFNCNSFPDGEDVENNPMVCMDGLQRLTAIRKFLNNEIKVFGSFIDDYEDKDKMLRLIHSLRFNINNLKDKEEVLRWYIDFNSGGTAHSETEIKRVQEILEKEIEKTPKFTKTPNEILEFIKSEIPFSLMEKNSGIYETSTLMTIDECNISIGVSLEDYNESGKEGGEETEAYVYNLFLGADKYINISELGTIEDKIPKLVIKEIMDIILEVFK